MLGAPPVFPTGSTDTCSVVAGVPIWASVIPFAKPLPQLSLDIWDSKNVKLATSTQIKCQKQYALKYCSRKLS